MMHGTDTRCRNEVKRTEPMIIGLAYLRSSLAPKQMTIQFNSIWIVQGTYQRTCAKRLTSNFIICSDGNRPQKKAVAVMQSSMLLNTQKSAKSFKKTISKIEIHANCLSSLTYWTTHIIVSQLTGRWKTFVLSSHHVQERQYIFAL